MTSYDVIKFRTVFSWSISYKLKMLIFHQKSIFLDKIKTQSVFLYLKHVYNNKMKIFTKFADFSKFSNFSETFDFRSPLRKLFRSGTYFIPSNLMVSLVLRYIYHLLQKLNASSFLVLDIWQILRSSWSDLFWPILKKIVPKLSFEEVLTSAK